MSLATPTIRQSEISPEYHKLNNLCEQYARFFLLGGIRLILGVATYGRTGRFAFKL